MKNPRGMQVAANKAKQIFEAGGNIADCPYKSKSWRSAFCHAMEKLQQQALL